MFSFFVTVAEGAEGPSSGFEVIAENLLNSMKGGHKKPWTISFHNHTILIHHKIILFSTLCQIHLLRKLLQHHRHW